jgi:predicted transcriptional regulator
MIPTLLTKDYRRLEDVAAGHIRLSDSGRQIVDRGVTGPYVHRGAVNVNNLITVGLIEITPGRREYRLTEAGAEVLAGWRAERLAALTDRQRALQEVAVRRGI